MVADPNPHGEFNIVHDVLLNELWDTYENEDDEEGFCSKAQARKVATRECDR